MSCVLYKVTQPQYKKAEILKLNKALNTWNVSAKAIKVAGTFRNLYLSWSGRETTKNGSRRGVVGRRFWPASMSDM